MKKIRIYRGKSLADGSWCYGSLIWKGSLKKGNAIAFIVEKTKDTNIKHLFSYIAPVNPYTVGQFTGMLDVNGRQIFEDDIVTSIHSAQSVGTVMFDNSDGSYYAASESDCFEMCEADRVIGNEFDGIKGENNND